MDKSKSNRAETSSPMDKSKSNRAETNGPFDIGIRCGYLLPMAGGSGEVLRDMFVGIRGNQIAVIAPWNDAESIVAPSAKGSARNVAGIPTESAAQGPAENIATNATESATRDASEAAADWKAHSKKFIDAKNQAILPGLINAHTHLPMTLFRGLADDLPFADWLFKTILPLESSLVDPEFVRVGTELAVAESIRFGVTTVCDMYFFEDVIAEAVEQSGLRAIVAEGIADFPTPDTKTGKGADYRIIERMLERYKNHNRIIPAIGPHAPYSCSDETLKKARDFARKHNIPLTIHVAETQAELEESKKKFGKTPTARLFDLGVLGENTICAHSVWLEGSDFEHFAKSGASAIYNPESNMKLAAGVAQIPRLLQAGIKVGIGTDGPASNNDLSIFREMDTGAKLQKLSHHDNTAMTALQALRLATLGGARALGIDQLTGSLELGKRADLIAVDLSYPHLQPVHDLVSQLVYSTSGLEVSLTIVDGQILMENSKLTQIDTQKIFRSVEKIRERIRKTLS